MTAATKPKRSTSDEPHLSVVMPVYNALPHLDAAVQSMLGQTYRDFEFVIYDDASTDGSTERLRKLAQLDSRIRLFEGKRNLGPVGSSTFVVEQSRGILVARMDADDVSLPTRLERQIQLFHDKPQAGLVGTLFEVIDGRGRRIRGPDYWRLARTSPFVPFAHASIMFRRTLFDLVGGYRTECEHWEDQDLVARMASAGEAWALPQPLCQFRQWIRNGGASSDPEAVENAVDTMYRSIERLQSNRWYDDVLFERHSHRPAKVDPRVFVAAGSRVLWAGGRPRVLGGMLKRARLGLDMRSITALTWGLWAYISPSSLLRFLRMVLRVRNARALKARAYDEPVRWSPTSTPAQAHSQTARHEGRLVPTADSL